MKAYNEITGEEETISIEEMKQKIIDDIATWNIEDLIQELQFIRSETLDGFSAIDIEQEFLNYFDGKYIEI